MLHAVVEQVHQHRLAAPDAAPHIDAARRLAAPCRSIRHSTLPLLGLRLQLALQADRAARRRRACSGSGRSSPAATSARSGRARCRSSLRCGRLADRRREATPRAARPPARPARAGRPAGRSRAAVRPRASSGSSASPRADELDRQIERHRRGRASTSAASRTRRTARRRSSRSSAPPWTRVQRRFGVARTLRDTSGIARTCAAPSAPRRCSRPQDRRRLKRVGIGACATDAASRGLSGSGS